MIALRAAVLTLVCLCSLWLRPCVAQAASRKVVVAIGSNTGLEHEEPLNFGTNDARDFATLMVELGGVAPSDVHLLLNPTKAALEARLDAVNGRLARDATLILYYSGHGNDSHLHLGGQAVAREWLKTKLGASNARLRLMFIDACRGVEERGFEIVPQGSQAIDVGRLEYSGLVLIQSASRGEVAFESRRLQGGLFTRHLLSGLRGPADVDRDGKVSLDEAYAFAHGHTLADSGSTQVPDREVVITGSGALELTTVVKTGSSVFLPVEMAVARYTFFRKGVRSVFAEAWSSRDGRMPIALPVGHFIVWRRSGESSRMTEIETEQGQTRYMAEVDFAEIERSEMQERGGTIPVQPPHRVTIAAGLAVAPRLDGSNGIGETVALEYAWVRDVESVSPIGGLSYYRESFDAGPNDVERKSYQLWAGLLSPALRLATPAIGIIQLDASVGLSATLTRQHKSSQTAAATQTLSFERLGALAQLTMTTSLSATLDWTLRLAANPTAFRERARNGAATDVDGSGTSTTHLALSTAVFLTTGCNVKF